MKTIKVILGLSTLWTLGGCIAVPVGGPGYYQPAPAYYGPSIGIGIYGRGGYRR